MRKFGLFVAILLSFLNLNAQKLLPTQGSEVIIGVRALTAYSNDFGVYECNIPTGYFTKLNSEFSQNVAIPLKGEQLLSYAMEGGQSYAYTAWKIATMPDFKVFRTAVNHEMVDILSGVQDPSTLSVYACIYDYLQRQNYWATINLSDFSIDRIAELPSAYSTLAADSEGNIYAINHNGDYLSIDKTTGQSSLIRNTGVTSDPSYVISAAYDPAGDRIVFSQITSPYAGSDGWFALDRTTGIATRLFNYGGNASHQWTALYVRPDRLLRPDKVTNLDLEFEYDPFVAKILFTCPQAPYPTYTGSLSYTLILTTISKESYSITGSARWGERVEVPIDLPENNYDVVVIVESDGGTSEPVGLSYTFIGKPKPLAPAQGTSAVYEDGNFKVTIKPRSNQAIPDNRRNFLVRLFENNTMVYERLTGEDVYTMEIPWPEPSEHRLYRIDVYGYLYGNLSGVMSLPGIPLGPDVYTLPFDCIIGDDHQFLTIYGLNSEKKITSTANGNWNQPDYDIDELWYRINIAAADKMEWLVIMPKMQYEARHDYSLDIDLACHSAKFLGCPRAGFAYVKSSDSVDALVREIRADKSTNHNNTREGAQKQLAAAFVYADRNPVSATREEPTHVSYNFSPEVSGEYYLALCVDNLGQGSPISGSTFWTKGYSIAEQSERNRRPRVPSVSAVGDSSAALAAAVTVTAPKIDVDGNPLVGELNARIYRNDTPIAELPFVDGSISYVDNQAAEGENTYTAVAYNTFGESAISEPALCFVGNTIAQPVSKLLASEDPSGAVTLTWPAVDKDTNDRPLSNVAYKIYRVEGQNSTYLATVDNALAYVDTYPASLTRQTRLGWNIVATTGKGDSDLASSNTCWLGRAYSMPFVETFDAENAGMYEFDAPTDRDERLYHWEPRDASLHPTIDGDGSALAFYSWYPTYYYLDFITAKLLVDPAAANPSLSFDYYAYADCDNTIDLAVSTDNGSTWSPLGSGLVTDAAVEGWQKCMVSLSAYSGKTIRVKITMTPRRIANRINDICMYLDNIRIFDPSSHDLAALRLSYSENPILGTGGTLELTLENNGLQSAGGYTVEFYCDGDQLGTVDGTPVLSASFSTARLAINPAATDFGTHTVSARIVWDADQQIANNRSKDVEVEFSDPDRHPVTDLRASSSEDGNVTLTWSAPDLSDVPTASITDSFEGETAWTLLGAFTQPAQNSGYEPHSGKSLIAANVAVDKSGWAVSPALDGSAQVVRIFARATTTDIIEAFEVYTSSTDNLPESMSLLATAWNVTTAWNEFSFSLPAGTKFFAIKFDVAVNRHANAIMVDDVTFTPAAGSPVYNLIGYNLYRDNVRLNAEPLADTRYTDTLVDLNRHRYAVSVVYDLGESALSDPVEVSLGAVGNISADPAVYPVEYYTIDGRRVENPAPGFVIIRMSDGSVVKTHIK